MRHLLITASTLALGLGLTTPVLAQSEDCIPGYGGCSGTGLGQTPFDRGEPDESERARVTPAPPAPPVTDPTPPRDECGDGCGDDSSAGSAGDIEVLALSDLQDLGLV